MTALIAARSNPRKLRFNCLHAVRTADTFFNALLDITRADIAFVDPFTPSRRPPV